MMLTNLCDTFRDQSRSPNMAPFNLLGMVSSECAIVNFWDILLKNAVTLKTGLGGPARSLEICTYDFLLTFYSNYGSISCRFWDIQCRKMSWPWNWGQRSLKVIESCTIRYIVYGFLLVFYSNFIPKNAPFLIYSTSKYTVTLKPVLGVTQGHRKLSHPIRHPGFPINVPW